MSEEGKIVVEFKENDPKKHSIRYNCNEADPAVASIYINREALAKIGTPDKVKITIEPLS